MTPRYNVWDNNCQTFTINLLNLICGPNRTKVLTNQLQYKAGEDEAAAQKELKVVQEAKAEAEESAADIMESNTPLLNFEGERTPCLPFCFAET
jgi:hypothetical protein